jgi:hypothetical protein
MGVHEARGRGAMRMQKSIVDARSPAQIAKAIVKVNKAPELRRAGLGALWKLYYAPEHSLARNSKKSSAYLRITLVCTAAPWQRSLAPTILTRSRLSTSRKVTTDPRSSP